MRHRVGSLAEIPENVGYMKVVGDRELALFRLGDRVHAVENFCPHRGGALAWGEVRGGVVHCPLHAWPFEIATGRCIEFPEVAVEVFPVTVEGGVVFVEL